VDGAAIGRLGAQALIARMAGSAVAVVAQDVGFEVVGRASTRGIADSS
jgi:LacI family gluconate utilization system Gnt-I transcriptional repressor